MLGLRELFEQAREVVGIEASPHERVSLMRLLLCIAQAALGGPPDRHGWAHFGDEFGPAALDYLGRPDIYPHFELFGSGPRFLQVAVPSKREAVPASKLMPHLATGNNPTPFDHPGGTKRCFPPSRLALALLTFQNFYPLYGAGYKGRGPCVDSNMAHTLLQGSNLGETLRLNALDEETIRENYPQEGLGRPLWESGSTGAAAQSVATLSYLGRLVPRHRNLWLHEDGAAFDLCNEALQYPAYATSREPTSTVVVVRQAEPEVRRLLSLRLERSAWRDLHSITRLDPPGQETQRAALSLQSHAGELARDGAEIWVGGLVTDLKAKILDAVEATITVPGALFTEKGQAIYEAGVKLAQFQSQQLFGAVQRYAAGMKNELGQHQAAARHFWNALDIKAALLLQLTNSAAVPGVPELSVAGGPWGRVVRRAARSAYEEQCQAVTPRQYQAYAEGLRVLLARPKGKLSPRGPIQKPTAVAAHSSQHSSHD